jgi:hypothetical protein
LCVGCIGSGRFCNAEAEVCCRCKLRVKLVAEQTRMRKIHRAKPVTAHVNPLSVGAITCQLAVGL